MKKLHVLLDLDDVLADFIGSALEVHEWEREDYIRERRGRWWMHEVMGLSLEAFCEPIEALGEVFWLSLAPLPWFNRLIEAVEKVDPEWYIVSSPGNFPGCYGGKAKWLKSIFGSNFDRFSITPQKWRYANENSILIDDNQENTAKFRERGGRSYLFPSSLSALDPIPTLASYLETEQCISNLGMSTTHSAASFRDSVMDRSE